MNTSATAAASRTAASAPVTHMPFVIWMHDGRCGSTHLVSLLNSHPDIYCEGEMFNVHYDDGQPRRERTSEHDALHALQHLQQRPETATGFKIKFPYQTEHYPDIQQQLLEQADTLRVITLRRENILRQAISGEYGRQKLAHKNWQLRHGDTICRSPVPVDVAWILAFVRFIEQSRSAFEASVAHYPHRYDLTYEQLLSNEAAVCSDILHFLQLPVYSLRSSTVKVAPPTLQEAVVNYDELATALRQNGYAAYLQG